MVHQAGDAATGVTHAGRALGDPGMTRDMSITFSETLERSGAQEGRLALSAPEDWMQGRSLYGGLQAALAIHAMQSLDSSRPLRSLQTNFIAPLRGEIRGETSVLRRGKNATQMEARLYAGDVLATQCMAIFGTSLDSIVSVKQEQPAIESENPIVFPFIAGVTPAFTQHFGMRLLAGNLPFSGKESTTSAYGLDLRDAGPVTKLHVTALADVVPPLGLSFVSAPTFGSTMSWMLEFLAEPKPTTSLEGWRLDSALLSAEGGYTHQTNTLWSPAGEAMALSRQCMLVFG